MKGKVALIISGVLLIIVSIVTGILGIVLPFIIPSKEYIPIIDQDFIKEMEKLNCETDVYVYSDDDEDAEKYPLRPETFVETKDSCPYYINYSDYSNDHLGEQYYQNVVNKLEDAGGNYAYVNFKDFGSYSLTVDNHYVIITKVGSTYIYAEVEKKDKEVINNFLKEIDYNYEPNTKLSILLIIGIVGFILGILLIILGILKRKKVTQ